jgi:hypothetical protein
MDYVKTWTTNLSPEEADELVLHLKGADTVLERLHSILDQRIEDSESKQCSEKAYDCPNWTYKQADAMGYQRALRMVQELITKREKDK